LDRFEAQGLVELLMGQWNLRGWRFDWLNSTCNLGDCTYRAKTIRLSLPYTLRLPEAGVRETRIGKPKAIVKRAASQLLQDPHRVKASLRFGRRQLL
jgi:hypothetical protein